MEVRTVNHRFFNPSIKTAVGARALRRGAARDAARRGHPRARDAGACARSATRRRAIVIDETRFAEYVARLRALEKAHGLTPSLDVATVLRLPDVMTSTPAEDER